MVYVPVQHPHCYSTVVIKTGKQPNGTQWMRSSNVRAADMTLHDQMGEDNEYEAHLACHG